MTSKIVPMEPTQEMTKAGVTRWHSLTSAQAFSAVAIWRAMYDAAPAVEKPAEDASAADTEALINKLRTELRKWCVSKYTHKCYICGFGWSDGAPQIHAADCLAKLDTDES